MERHVSADVHPSVLLALKSATWTEPPLLTVAGSAMAKLTKAATRLVSMVSLGAPSLRPVPLLADLVGASAPFFVPSLLIL